MTRCGLFSFAGAPNAGKSTLLNRLTGRMSSIATRKAQTTRIPIRAATLEGDAQLVLSDTPGLTTFDERGESGLDRAMKSSARRAIRDSDMCLLVVDAAAKVESEAVGSLLSLFSSLGAKTALVLNKIDLLRGRESLLSRSAELNSRHEFSATFMISASTGDGVADLRRDLASRCRVGPHLFSSSWFSDVDPRIFASEATRKALLLATHDEIPYSATVETVSYETESRGGSVCHRIEQHLLVDTASRKGIVIGRGGATLRRIVESSRRHLISALGVDVDLSVRVKVRKGWMNSPSRLRAAGFDDSSLRDSFGDSLTGSVGRSGSS